MMERVMAVNPDTCIANYLQSVVKVTGPAVTTYLDKIIYCYTLQINGPCR